MSDISTLIFFALLLGHVCSQRFGTRISQNGLRSCFLTNQVPLWSSRATELSERSSRSPRFPTSTSTYYTSTGLTRNAEIRFAAVPITDLDWMKSLLPGTGRSTDAIFRCGRCERRWSRLRPKAPTLSSGPAIVLHMTSGTSHRQSKPSTLASPPTS
jgi:hypothetical protein